MAPQVDRLQVAEHPGHHEVEAARSELQVAQHHRPADQLGDPTLTALAVEQRACVERVDEDRLVAPTDPQHEMRRQVDPLHLQAKPVGHRPVEHREADRDPRLVIDHLIEVAVLGVVVVLGVALEPFLDEQDPVDLPQDLPRLRGRRGPVADPGRQGLDPLQVGAGLEVRMASRTISSAIRVRSGRASRRSSRSNSGLPANGERPRQASHPPARDTCLLKKDTQTRQPRQSSRCGAAPSLGPTRVSTMPVGRQPVLR